MSFERNIVKRLLESNFEDLDEKTYTVGDTQYWKRGGKTYKWTESGGRQECSEDEYFKALSGGTSGDDKVKNTAPDNDKAKDTASSNKSEYAGPTKKVIQGKTFKVDTSSGKPVIKASMYDTNERLSKLSKFAKENGITIEYEESKKKKSDPPIPNGMRSVQTPSGEMYRVDSKSGSDFIQINPTGKGKYELVVYDNGSLAPTDKKQDLSKGDAFKLAKDAMDKSEWYKTGRKKVERDDTESNTELSSIEKRPNAPRIGNKVKILHGGYRGQIGKIVDYDFDDEEGDQYSVEAPDGSIRYLDDTDIELVKDRDDSESDYINYDGVRNFDHTTWMIDGYETTIQKNPSGIGYYLQNEDYDEEFDTKGDLVNYLRDRKGEFQGYDSENDY